MQTRSAISLFTLIAFLPWATGCSTARTSYVQDDVVSDRTTSKLASGDQVWISGYTTSFDGFHRWSGHVSAAGTDSLEFAKRDRESDHWRTPKEPPFRIARADVISVEVETPDGGKTVALAALVVGVLAITMVVSVARGINEGFEPLRNLGKR